MSYQKLAEDILNHVGGEENINGLTHCATRLRFNLKDSKIPDMDYLKSLDGVIGVVSGGGQFQVIIGSDVPHVYKEIADTLHLDNEVKTEKSDKKLGARFIETISSIFTPILPAITASGMLKAVLSLCIAFKWVDSKSQIYQIINFMADAAFYFLPILLANSAAKKFKTNPYLAMMLAGILLHPSFIGMVAASKETGEAIKFGFMPIYNATYASSVIPIILAVWMMSYVERFMDKISPKMIKFFTVPLITIMVTGLLTLVVLGPIGYVIGNYIAKGVLAIEQYAGWLLPMLLGAFFPLLVMTGTHYGIIPIGANNIMSLGYDTIVGPGNLASNIAQGGAALAVGLKTRDSNEKQQAISAGVTAVCGITEPALFGVNIKHKTPLYSAMIGGGIGGLFIGIFGVRRYATGSPGLLTLPVYIGDDGLSNFMFACIGALIAFVVAFVISYIWFKPESSKDKVVETPKTTMTHNEAGLTEHTTTVYAPVNGDVIALSDVKDEAFASGAVGKGAAIVPTDGYYVSPIKGEVVMVFGTKHAIGLKSDDGVEVLLHIGIDTVKLEGKHFDMLVEKGARVEVGTPLVNVDIDALKAEGYDITTPIIITNTLDYSDVLSLKSGDVEAGRPIIKGVR